MKKSPSVSGAFALRSIRIPLAGLVLLAGAALAQAGPRDHEDARLAVTRGEIRALADILDLVRGRLPGEVTGVEIERKDGRWFYEFRVVDGRGRLFEVYVDGTSGEIARIKEK
ncbi:MAG: PepSY domain-containing protein [Pseudorhodoplanes sp.]|nr:PepSY domain-containing protein [Pseudorhodoplanes sp.]